MQYAVRAIRGVQAAAVVSFFFGANIAGSLGRPTPGFVSQMHENKLLAAAGIYAIDVVAQTLKAINAFEVTYNGQLLHSKLKSGRFPDAGDVVARLRQAMVTEQAEADAPPEVVVHDEV